MDSKSLPDGWLDGEIELTAFALANPDCDVRAVLAGFAALVRRNDQIEAGGDVRVGPERTLADYYRRALTPPFAVARRAGKYYGTLVLDSEGTEVLKFWSAEGEPSSRERAYFGEWTPEKWRDYLSDSHWECEGDLAAAEAFVAIVNADLEVGDIRVGPPEQNLEMDERAIRRLQAQWRDPDCTGWTCPHCGRVTNYKPDTECDDCGFDITETVRVGDPARPQPRPR